MSDFTLTAENYSIFGGNTYNGYATDDLIPGTFTLGAISSGAELAGATILAFYAETIQSPTSPYSPISYAFVAVLEGAVSDSWCASFTDYVGNSQVLESSNAVQTTSTAGNSVFTFSYPLSDSTAPKFGIATASYPITDCTPTSCSGDDSSVFNCDCESIPLPADGYTIDTLANLRQRVLIRAGYAAQAANPPPGMVLLVNEFLRDAQNQLYRQHFEKRLRRLYSWPMVVNQRYYGFSQTFGADCRVMNPLAVDWVGFEDCNQAWYPLICGIDPVLYTRAQISTGWPTHYEIRSCIEIFPAPRSAYTLWVKGLFGLDPFVADTDCTTVDAEAVYLLATGMLKAHYSQPDAGALLTQALSYTKYLVAGQHDTRRYVPRTRVQTPMTPPRFLPLEE